MLKTERSGEKSGGKEFSNIKHCDGNNSQVHKYEIRTSCLKKHIKFGRMIKSALFKICSIAFHTFFPPFGQFVDTTPVKSSPFTANHSSSHFFTSPYESKCCRASA